MRNAFFLLLFGLVAFVGYSWWTDPDGFRKQVSEKLGAAGTAKKNTPAAKPDDAAVVVRELAAFASQNTEMILAPLAGIGLETAPATLADLKIRLNTELSKALVPAEKARLQAAMQLVGVMEQGILQRADHLKRRRAVEYREPPETGSRARVSPAEITAKMRQADFSCREWIGNGPTSPRNTAWRSAGCWLHSRLEGSRHGAGSLESLFHTMPSSDRLPDRKVFRVRLAQSHKVVAAMVLPPLLIGPAIFFLAKIKALPEWAVITVIFTMVISITGTAIWLVMKGIPFVDYSIEGERHHVEVLRPTFLSVRSFGFDFGEVRGLQIGHTKGRFYFTLEVPGYPGKFSINAASDREEDVVQFDALMSFVAAKVSDRKESGRNP